MQKMSLCLIVLLLNASAWPESFRLVGWNLQSDRPNHQEDTSDPQFIKDQIAIKTGVSLWGLCEVYDQQEFNIYKQAAEQTAGHSLTGEFRSYSYNDGLAIIFDPQVFEATGAAFSVPNWDGDRPGLVQPLRWKATNDQFLFVINHLNRSNSARRQRQAGILNQWAASLGVPIVVAGDYNMDYEFQPEGPRDAAYDNITQNGVFVWARPIPLLKTNASDDYRPSVLDFVFVARQPATWMVQSRILNREDNDPATALDFDDDNRSTDHRPLDAIISTVDGGGPNTPPSLDIQAIKQRLEAIEAEVRALRALIDPH